MKKDHTKISYPIKRKFSFILLGYPIVFRKTNFIVLTFEPFRS